jgi:hypothetical protein
MAFQDVATNLGLSEEVVKAIPEELRNDKSFEPIKDFTGLMTSFRDGQKMIGGSVRIPKEDAKPEEIEAFYNKLGRPEKSDGYKYSLPYPEYIAWDQDRIKDFVANAHKSGFTPKQVQTALDWYGKTVAEDYQAKKTAFESATATLKTEWGGAFDRNLALAKRARDLYGGEEAKAFFADDPSGNDPILIKMLAKMASDLEEGDYLGGPGEPTGLTTEDAKSKIAEVLKNPEDLYHAKFAGKPGHEERVKEVQTWYDQAYRAI